MGDSLLIERLTVHQHYLVYHLLWLLLNESLLNR